MTFESFCSQDTFDFGKKLGTDAEPGSVYCLIGDLGTGKTVFTQGFAAGLGVEGPVNSPTFTIVSVYEGTRMPFYHFDVYRIEEEEEMEEIGYEDYFYGNGAVLIEWANLIPNLIPAHYTEITIEKDLDRGFDFRRIRVEQK